MRKVLLFLTFGLCVLTAFAVPAKRERCLLMLADGSTIEATRMGDEMIHFYVTDDGQYLQCDTMDIAHFVDAEEIHTRWHAKMTKRHNARIAKKAARSTPKWSMLNGAMTGSKRGLVILVQFPDVPFYYTNETFQRFFNEEGYHDNINIGSVRDYFLNASYGQFDFSFDIIGPITMSQPLAYYGANNENGDDVHPAEMVIEAVNMIDDEVDFTQYDWDGDGKVEQIFIIHSGHDEAQSSRLNDIWSHAWTLTEAVDENDGDGPVTVDGVVIDSYATSSELRNRAGFNIAGVGTACHEFSHCFGLPDTYDTVGYNFGMSSWDIMDYGTYNGDGGTPAGFTSYERMFCGWLQPKELTEPAIVWDMPALTSEPVAYILRNSGKYDEYYLLENRQKEGWDGNLAGHGMLILHVDYDKQAWEENTVNNVRSHQRMTIIPADNMPYNFNLAGDPWPGTSGNTELSDISIPAATLYNKNADGEMLMNHSISGITESKSGLISFVFDDDPTDLKDFKDLKDFRDLKDPIFNLAGQKTTNVNSPGIYILEGKKILKR